MERLIFGVNASIIEQSGERECVGLDSEQSSKKYKWQGKITRLNVNHNKDFLDYSEVYLLRHEDRLKPPGNYRDSAIRIAGEKG